MSDSFGGAWRVREYVFDARGNALGTVAQRRRLVGDGDRLRVIQDCEPDPSLIDHPMRGFAGHHEFELAREGALRRYLGPAVVGCGVAYGDRAVLGAGVWPEFGHDFSSWSLMVAPGRQLTGGRFARAGLAVAEIVGVASPEDRPWPELMGPTAAGAIARAWIGAVERFDGDGGGGEERALRRVCGGAGHAEGDDRIEVDREGAVSGALGGARVVGRARRYGWATRYRLAVVGGALIDGIDAVDPEARRLCGFRRWRDGQRVTRVDVFHLQPDEERHDAE